MTDPPPRPLLDASSLPNLCATGRLREIAAVLPYRPRVAGHVLAWNAPCIRRPHCAGGGARREQADLSNQRGEVRIAAERP